jgi:hypothetical protein
MPNITWSAKNNSNFLDGSRAARTMRGAVRDARRYLYNELYGEGIITYYVDGVPVRQDERSIHTGYRWVSRKATEG